MKHRSRFSTTSAFSSPLTKKVKSWGGQARVWPRRAVQVSLASGVAAMGLLVLAPNAFAHADLVSGVVTCASTPGAGYDIAWSVTNDYNLSETAHVTAVTGGISEITPSSFGISASGNGSGGNGVLPYKSVSLSQVLPSTASGTVDLTVASLWSDGFAASSSGAVTLPTTCQIAVPPAITPPTTVTTIAPVVPPTTVPPTTVPPVVPPVAPPVTAAVVVPKLGLSIVKTERVATDKTLSEVQSTHLSARRFNIGLS